MAVMDELKKLMSELAGFFRDDTFDELEYDLRIAKIRHKRKTQDILKESDTAEDPIKFLLQAIFVELRR